MALGSLWHLLRRDTRIHTIDLALLAYVALHVFSWLAQGSPWSLGNDWLLLEGSACLVFLLAGESLRRKAMTPDQLVAVMVWTAGGVALLTLVEALGVTFPWSPPYRPTATIGHRNFVALYLATATPLALYYCLRKPKFPQFCIVTLSVIAIILCRARGSWTALLIALPVMLGLMWVTQPRIKRPRFNATFWLGVTPVLAAVALAVLLPWRGLSWRENDPLFASLFRLTDINDGTGKQRIEEHDLSLLILEESPWLGHGPNLWARAYPRYASATDMVRHPSLSPQIHPHSQPLQVLIDTGLLGIFVAALIAVALLWRSLSYAWAGRVSSETLRDEPLLLRNAVFASLLVATIVALVETPLSNAGTAVLIAGVASLSRQRFREVQTAGVARCALFSFTVMAVTIVAGTAAKQWAFAPLWFGVTADEMAKTQQRYPSLWMPYALTAMVPKTKEGCAAATATFDEALTLNPNSVTIHWRKAECLGLLGDLAGMEREFNAATQLDPTNPKIAKAWAEARAKHQPVNRAPKP
jgi:hypothetical protein